MDKKNKSYETHKTSLGNRQNDTTDDGRGIRIIQIDLFTHKVFSHEQSGLQSSLEAWITNFVETLQRLRDHGSDRSLW